MAGKCLGGKNCFDGPPFKTSGWVRVPDRKCGADCHESIFFFFGILLYSLLLFYILLKPNAGEKGISNDKYTIKKIEFNHVPVSCAVIFVDRCGWQLLTDIPNTATHPVLCHHFRTWMHLPKDTVTSRFKHNADVENAF